jgi:hypothetical protein
VRGWNNLVRGYYFATSQLCPPITDDAFTSVMNFVGYQYQKERRQEMNASQELEDDAQTD